MLAVRFHYGGEFFFDGNKMHYHGGSEGLSYIERDLISLPEITGHLKDHGVDVDGVLLHWLRPSTDLGDGLRVLHDDSVCLAMSDHIKGSGVAEVFVESTKVQLETPDEDSSDEVQYIGENRISAIQPAPIKIEECQQPQISSKVGESDSSSDSEYLPGGFCSSEDDDEAKEIEKKFKEFKVKCKAQELKSLDDVVYTSASQTEIAQPDLELIEGCDLVDGNSTPYADSSGGEDESFEECSGEEVIGKEENFDRFDRKADIPDFSLGTKFSGKKEFKEAIVKYGLATRRVLKFIKDEGDRVRVICDWPMCPWVCLLKKTSLADSWLVTSLKDEHTCPQRRQLVINKFRSHCAIFTC